jgi:hypothetical protein
LTPGAPLRPPLRGEPIAPAYVQLCTIDRAEGAVTIEMSRAGLERLIRRAFLHPGIATAGDVLCTFQPKKS